MSTFYPKLKTALSKVLGTQQTEQTAQAVKSQVESLMGSDYVVQVKPDANDATLLSIDITPNPASPALLNTMSKLENALYTGTPPTEVFDGVDTLTGLKKYPATMGLVPTFVGGTGGIGGKGGEAGAPGGAGGNGTSGSIHIQYEKMEVLPYAGNLWNTVEYVPVSYDTYPLIPYAAPQPILVLAGSDEDEEEMQTESLFSSKQDNWCTPQEVVDMLKFLGPIRLDPCSNSNSLIPAAFKYDLKDGFDGLETPWDLTGMRYRFGPNVKDGYVYVNPPYGKTIGSWTSRAAAVYKEHSTEIVMLVPARTDTKWWQGVIGETAAVCFLKGRLKFKDAPSSAPFPSALLYFGKRTVEFCTNLSSKGWTVSQ